MIYIYFQQEWLLKLQNFSPFNIWVSKNTAPGNPKPSKWFRLLDYPFFKHGLIDYRTVLPNEICIEMDFCKWSNQRFWGRRIDRVLWDEGIDHLMYHSGGKGVHFSVFYHIDGLNLVTGWKQVRLKLWNYILNLADVPKRMRGLEKPFDITSAGFSDGNVDMTVPSNKGHLIREIGGKKRQVKRPITKIPKENCILTGEIKWPKKIPVWHVPIKLLSKFDFTPKLSGGECDHCRVEIPAQFEPIFLDDETEDYGYWIGCWFCKAY